MYQADDFMLGNDEHSALVRLNYDSVGEVIEKGVKPDGHPAGVQLFMYAWTSAFGTSTWVVRFPFVLLGLLSLWYAYLLGKKWFGITVGVMVAGLLATSSYMILHHLAARPYAAGMCFVLGLAWHQERLLESGSRKDAALVILFAALSAYTHYFAGLQAALIGLVCLFRCPRKHLKLFIFSWLATALLYVPHFGIFFSQIKTGGIGGWLAAPKLSLFADWFQIGLNGWLPIALILGLILFVRLFARSYLKEYRGPLGYVFLLGMLPFVIGYIYSHARNPVLHMNSLVFSFPFALLAFLGGFGEIKSKNGNLVFTLLILLIGTLALTLNRKHYELFYNRGTGQLARALIAENPTGLASIASANNPEYVRYHVAGTKPHRDFDRYTPGNYVEFRRWASQPEHERLLWGWAGLPMDLTYAAIAREQFPTVISETWKPTTEIFLFQRSAPISPETPVVRHWLEDSVQFGPSEDRILSEVSNCRHEVMHIYTDFRAFSTPDPDLQLVVSLQDELTGERLHWESKKLSLFYDTLQSESWQRAHFVKRMRYLHEPPYNRIRIQAYIWNPGGSELEVKGAPVMETWAGNPSIYGFMEWVHPCAVEKPSKKKQKIRKEKAITDASLGPKGRS